MQAIGLPCNKVLIKNQDSLTLLVAGKKVHIESMAILSERLAERINKALAQRQSQS